MQLNDYQQYAVRTEMKNPDRTFRRLILALGLAGEAGEIADYVKKVIGHGHDFDRAKFIKEVGDELWYIATLCHEWDISLDEVAHANIEKLTERYPDGFSREASIARVDTTAHRRKVEERLHTDPEYREAYERQRAQLEDRRTPEQAVLEDYPQSDAAKAIRIRAALETPVCATHGVQHALVPCAMYDEIMDVSRWADDGGAAETSHTTSDPRESE